MNAENDTPYWLITQIHGKGIASGRWAIFRDGWQLFDTYRTKHDAVEFIVTVEPNPKILIHQEEI